MIGIDFANVYDKNQMSEAVDMRIVQASNLITSLLIDKNSEILLTGGYV